MKQVGSATKITDYKPMFIDKKGNAKCFMDARKKQVRFSNMDEAEAFLVEQNEEITAIAKEQRVITIYMKNK